MISELAGMFQPSVTYFALSFHLWICFGPPAACACALKAERSRTLRDSLAGSVFRDGFVPDGGESGGLMISLMLCVDQGHGTVQAWGK